MLNYFGGKMKKFLIICSLTVAIFSDIYSQDGSLDSSFDTDGTVITSIGSSSDYAQSAAIQSDGKLVVAGYSWNGSDWDFAVVRYNSDGSLDASFDTDGKVTTDITGNLDRAYSIAIQTDGKIIVVGDTYNGSDFDFAIVRYNSDGSLDTSFDTDGKITTAVRSSSDQAFAVAIQSDGKIVVVGNSYSSTTNNDFAIVRYNSDGSLDTSFDSDGKTTVDISTSLDDGRSVVIQSDGKIVVAGYSFNGSNFDFAVVRYNTDGSLDTSFDSDGILTTSLGTSDDQGYSLAVQSDGKIIVAGNSNNGTDNDFAVVRYNSDGSLDTSFDSNGIVTTAIGSMNDYGRSIAIQTDDKIVVAGYTHNGLVNSIALVRYNSDGSLDNDFDTGGKLTTDINADSRDDDGQSIIIQSDGKLIVAGSSYDGSVYNFTVARYNVTIPQTGDLTYGAAQVFNSSTVYNTDVSTISETEVAIAFQDYGDSQKGKVLIGIISGSLVSFGSVSTFNTYPTYSIKTSMLDSSTIVIAYNQDISVGNRDGFAIIGSISDATISFGTAVQFNSGFALGLSITKLSGSKFIISYQDNDNSGQGTAIVGSVSGTSITFGSEYIFDTDYVNYTSVATLDENNVIIAYTDIINTDYGTGIVGSVSGTDLSFGTPNTFNSSKTSNLSCQYLDATHFVVSYTDVNAGNGTSIIGTVSGSTISKFGSKYIFKSGPASSISCARLDATHFLIAYYSLTEGKSIVGSITNSDQMSFATENSYSLNPSGISATSLSNNSGNIKVLIAYGDGNNSYYGTAKIGEVTNVALPVELVSFEGALTDSSTIHLTWQTSTEVNNYGFEIERQKSADRNQNTDWESIGFVPGAGNSNSQKEYQFIDNEILNGTIKYRLKQIDIDGDFTYSNEIEISNLQPIKFALYQNYPNPFNPSTTIKFSLPAQSRVNLEIYNILGERVATLLNKEMESGFHQLEWNASNISSGIYFYKINTGKFSAVKKLMLLK